ncbi:hypothetical protein DWUX_1256 [Desulfovibrio diazotrophicus]|nr:hypothetical protein DWUX_1256 [Desulfovibrio diazotrophicus]
MCCPAVKFCRNVCPEAVRRRQRRCVIVPAAAAAGVAAGLPQPLRRHSRSAHMLW